MEGEDATEESFCDEFADEVGLVGGMVMLNPDSGVLELGFHSISYKSTSAPFVGKYIGFLGDRMLAGNIPYPMFLPPVNMWKWMTVAVALDEVVFAQFSASEAPLDQAARYFPPAIMGNFLQNVDDMIPTGQPSLSGWATLHGQLGAAAENVSAATGKIYSKRELFALRGWCGHPSSSKIPPILWAFQETISQHHSNTK